MRIMKKIELLSVGLALSFSLSFGQSEPFDRISFIMGDWAGEGTGFGNEKSRIESSFKTIMDGIYIEVQNESYFDPTEENPEGEHHIDKGFISFDKTRGLFVFRQFNNEGYVNQYILNDSLSCDSLLVFETEIIENFVAGGKARWTIRKIAEDRIETIFDVSFPNREYTCFGTNRMIKNQMK